jgi:hypothetical protein
MAPSTNDDRFDTTTDPERETTAFGPGTLGSAYESRPPVSPRERR